jgi:endoglucanase Acf2
VARPGRGLDAEQRASCQKVTPSRIVALAGLWFLVALTGLLHAERIDVGSGSYMTDRSEGPKGPPETILRTEKVRGPMPSNDWWSSAAWPGESFPQYPHPLAVKTEPEGLRIYYPGPSIRSDRAAIYGSMPGGKEDFVLGHSAVDDFPRPLVDGFSDWFVDLRFATNNASLHVSYGHGSPYVYALYQGGEPRLTFGSAPSVMVGDEHSPTLSVNIHGRRYGLFAPLGSTWSGLGTKTISCDTKGKGYFSVAVLPDGSPATLDLFGRHAHTHVVGTKVLWSYDPHSAVVTTRFDFETVAREGDERGTLFAMYPHQWRNTDTTLLPLGYRSVRGVMKLAVGTSFATRTRFAGILPGLPDVGGTDKDRIARDLAVDLARPGGDARDTYWVGKQLGRLATLLPITEQYRLPETAAVRARVRGVVEDWFSAQSPNGKPKAGSLFGYDRNWGTLIGYPASYGSDRELNDHHFHYGYFIKAAAEIAREDPEWARSDRWGGMVELLIRDVASPERSDPLFPFLRCFDPYAGHSWASGSAQFADGNNNESSSEAMNAWSGLVLWGEATGNTRLRDLGVWLHTTEMQAIQEYWFDVWNENHPRDFSPSVVTMIWGGKGANGTWFTADPQLVHGINWLPIHGGSLYLGHFPGYAAKNYEALVAEHGGDPWNNWPDLIWMYRAFSDPAEAHRLLDAAPSNTRLEDGNSWVNTRHWITNLERLGTPDPSIVGSEPMAAVFRRGSRLSYVVYSLAEGARTVRFSDGTSVAIKARGFTVKTREK